MPHVPFRLPLRGAALLALSATLALSASAEPLRSHTIYVAARSSDAHATAEARADGRSSFAERSLHRGLARAVALFAAGADEVVLKVAAGEYDGQVGAGVWPIGQVDAARGRFRLLGGYDAAFAARDPFGTPTVLVTSPGRSGAFFEFARRSKLAELVISGFVFDAAGSNVYDSETNSLVRGSGTRTYPLIAFRQFELERLVVADNVFVNAPQGVFDPQVKPASGTAEIVIQNNFFLNSLIPIQKLGADGVSRPIHTLRFVHNTVVLNWPLNPDRTSSNVGAIAFYHNGGADRLEIERNLFAYNVGGAFQHDVPIDRMPAVRFRDNLFWENGYLFDATDDPAGAVFVGKFGPNPRYLLVDLYAIEDDFDYDAAGNVALDPDLYIDFNFFAEMEEEEDWAEIYVDGFAPRMAFHADDPPFPLNPDAAPYGVQRSGVWRD